MLLLIVLFIELVIIGAFVGAQFADTHARKLMQTLLMSSVLTFALLALAVLFAWTLSHYTGFEFAAVFLAFIPGGIAEVSLVAVLLHIDPIFVAAHHIFRVLLIFLLSPLLATRWQHQDSSTCDAASSDRSVSRDLTL